MENRGYTIIQDWMLDLPLSYTEIAIYAIIYGFSQDGESSFRGSLGYLATKCKSSRDTARRALRKMEELGYIERIVIPVNGVEFNTYKVCKGGIDLQGGIANCKGEGSKLQPNNKDNNIDISCVSNKGSRLFCPPTESEVRDYCNERRNNVNAEAFFAYYESNGWMVGKNKMKDWKAAVRTWEQKDRVVVRPRPMAQPQETNLQRINRMMAEVMGGLADEQ